VSQLCTEMVTRGGNWRPIREACGRPAKRDGRCGVHANRHDRREAEKTRSREARETREAAAALAAALTAATAIPFNSDHRGYITLTSRAAENLLSTLN
jgi:hypothetical protein